MGAVESEQRSVRMELAKRMERLGTEPTRTGRSLRDVLDFFPS